MDFNKDQPILSQEQALVITVTTMTKKIAKQIPIYRFSWMNVDQMAEIENGEIVGWVCRDAIEDCSLTMQLLKISGNRLVFTPRDQDKCQGPQIFVV